MTATVASELQETAHTSDPHEREAATALGAKRSASGAPCPNYRSDLEPEAVYQAALGIRGKGTAAPCEKYWWHAAAGVVRGFSQPSLTA